jgi:hypothetical protein
MDMKIMFNLYWEFPLTAYMMRASHEFMAKALREFGTEFAPITKLRRARCQRASKLFWLRPVWPALQAVRNARLCKTKLSMSSLRQSCQSLFTTNTAEPRYNRFGFTMAAPYEVRP